MIRCPFCKHDPFFYVHNGLGNEPVAVDCCDLGVMLWSRDKSSNKKARQVLAQMQSYSPRKKARAMRTMREFGIR